SDERHIRARVVATCPVDIFDIGVPFIDKIECFPQHSCTHPTPNTEFGPDRVRILIPRLSGCTFQPGDDLLVGLRIENDFHKKSSVRWFRPVDHHNILGPLAVSLQRIQLNMIGRYGYDEIPGMKIFQKLNEALDLGLVRIYRYETKSLGFRTDILT